MKKIKFFAMALAAVAIVSCSKENMSGDNNGQPPVEEGVETYASFSFKVEGSGTNSKATETDENKTDHESDVNNIRIVIFKAGTPSTLEVNYYQALTDGALTPPPVKLTSGQKRIFVFANTENNTYLKGLTVGYNLNDCYASLMATPSPFSLDEFVGATDGYFMSNARTKSSSKTLLPNISEATAKTVGEANNHFKFTVQRAVAKVNAKIVSDDILTLVDPLDQNEPKATIATLSELKYTARNINKSIRPVQLFPETDITDADAVVKTTLPLAPYFNNYDGKDVEFMKILANYSDYDRSSTCDQLVTTVNTNTNAVFITENTNARQVLGNTTYLAVEAKYDPTAVVGGCAYDSELNDGTFTPVAGTKGADFYMVNLAGLKKIGKPGQGLKNNLFDTEVNAKALLTAVLDANDIKPVENKEAYDAAIAERIFKYAGGLTYYRLNIGVTESGKTTFGIKRNSVYNVVIKKINKLGASSIGDLDKNPEIPVTSLETYVTATITVAEWTTMSQEGEL